MSEKGSRSWSAVPFPAPSPEVPLCPGAAFAASPRGPSPPGCRTSVCIQDNLRSPQTSSGPDLAGLSSAITVASTRAL